MADMMKALLDMVGSGDELGQIAGLLGADSGAAEKGVAAALPALLGGLAKNAQSEEGAASLLGALDKHDGSVLNNIGGLGDMLGDGSKILGHVFGDQQSQVAGAVAKESGLDLGMVTKLLPMLAPVVMGFLGKQKAAGGLDAGSLAGALGKEQEGLMAGGMGGMLGMLDRDGDGNPMNDITGMLGGAAGGGGGSTGGKSGIMGMLSKLLGRK